MTGRGSIPTCMKKISNWKVHDNLFTLQHHSMEYTLRVGMLCPKIFIWVTNNPKILIQKYVLEKILKMQAEYRLFNFPNVPTSDHNKEILVKKSLLTLQTECLNQYKKKWYQAIWYPSLQGTATHPWSFTSKNRLLASSAPYNWASQRKHHIDSSVSFGFCATSSLNCSAPSSNLMKGNRI